MEKKIITSANAPTPIGPYSHSVLAGNTLYISGQVAKDAATGEMIQTDIKAETNKVMQNLKAILLEANMDFSNVVKATIYCTNLADFAAINEVYGTFFTTDFPARETVQVVKLPLNANVEITLLETESLCSKAQAEQMLKKFFDTYPSKIINIKHRGASAQGAKYAIASYETESGLKLRLYIFMKNNLIHELKVERE